MTATVFCPQPAARPADPRCSTSGWHRDHRYSVAYDHSGAPASAWIYGPSHAGGTITHLTLYVSDPGVCCLGDRLAGLVEEHIDGMIAAAQAARAARIEARDRAFAATLAAEDAWQAEMVRRFGRDACNARYLPKGKGEEGSPLRQLHDALVAARTAWRATLGV